MKRLSLPLSEREVRSLSIGDEVSLSGKIVTARDMAHREMAGRPLAFLRPLLKGGAIYHCGPVMKREGAGWKALAAGPTTSIRLEPYEARVIQQYRVRVIIGKGGMGPATLAACRRFGAVYVQVVGGAAPLIAEAIVKISGVHRLKAFGAAEALWEFEVAGLTGVVTMDASGRSLHEELLRETRGNRDRLIGRARSH